MEYYFYVIIIFVIVLKLTVYLCWYQVRQRSATREVRIIMPDGSTRWALTAARGRSHQGQRLHASAEERQILAQADSLSPYDNQGMVETPVQPRYGDMVVPQGLPDGTPSLPKYEEVVGMPPPYSKDEEPEMACAVQPGDALQPMPPHAPLPPPVYPGNTSIPVSSAPPGQTAPQLTPTAQLVNVGSPSSDGSSGCMAPATIPSTDSQS